MGASLPQPAQTTPGGGSRHSCSSPFRTKASGYFVRPQFQPCTAQGLLRLTSLLPKRGPSQSHPCGANATAPTARELHPAVEGPPQGKEAFAPSCRGCAGAGHVDHTGPAGPSLFRSEPARGRQKRRGQRKLGLPDAPRLPLPPALGRVSTCLTTKSPLCVRSNLSKETSHGLN